jgi:hypothetical protein
MSDNQEIIDFEKLERVKVREHLLEVLRQVNPRALLLDVRYEDCIVGISEITDPPKAVYSSLCIINNLMKRDGMDYEEAREYFDFNISGSHMGENTPMYISSFGSCTCDYD